MYKVLLKKTVPIVQLIEKSEYYQSKNPRIADITVETSLSDKLG